jgi:hypothetical protein
MSTFVDHAGYRARIKHRMSKTREHDERVALEKARFAAEQDVYEAEQLADPNGRLIKRHETLDEHQHLRRSPENARRLSEAIEDIEAGRVIDREKGADKE